MSRESKYRIWKFTPSKNENWKFIYQDLVELLIHFTQVQIRVYVALFLEYKRVTVKLQDHFCQDGFMEVEKLLFFNYS